MRAVERAERWMFAPGDPRRLAAIRIGLCAVLAERLLRDVYVGLADQPAALFRPLSFMNLLPAMPSRGVVVVAQTVGVAAAAIACMGLWARGTLPLAFGCALLLGGMLTSAGKVVHNDVVLLLAVVPLLAAPVSDAWSLDALRSKKSA